jgi:hypothetical protein
MTDSEQARAVYLAYPRHVAPRAALKAIQKAVERLVKDKAQPDEQSARRHLWKMATLYARSPAGQKPPKGCDDFRPHPTTWFNQDRFADDPREWQKPNGVSVNGISNHSTKQARTIAAGQAVAALFADRASSNGNGSAPRRPVGGDGAGDCDGTVIDGAV